MSEGHGTIRTKKWKNRKCSLKGANVSKIIRRIAYVIVAKLSEIIFVPGTEVRGMDNLPKKGGFIIAANHISILDPFVFIGIMRKFLRERYKREGKKIYAIGNAKLREKPLFAFFLKEDLGFIPNTKDGSFRAAKLLNDGHIVVIAPEGGVNLKDYIVRGKKGVAYMSMLSGAPVVPAVSVGQPAVIISQGIKTLFKPKKVIIGSPMSFPKRSLFYLKLNPLSAFIVTHKIMFRIAKLAGKKYKLHIKHTPYKKQ